MAHKGRIPVFSKVFLDPDGPVRDNFAPSYGHPVSWVADSLEYAPVAQLGEPGIDGEAQLRPGERPDRMSGLVGNQGRED